MDKFYLDINLSRWAVIQYSSHIWKQPEWKKHLAKTSAKSSVYEIDTMPAELRDELDNLVLPHGLKNELKFAIGSMGTKIRQWLRTMKTLNNYYATTPWTDFIDYIDHVHWSHLGSINLAATIKSLHKSGLFPINFHAWLWLCDNCMEECITDFWEKISQNYEYYDLISSICSSGRSRHYLMCYYWRLRMQNNLEELKSNITWHSLTYSNWKTVDECMFKKSHEEYYQSFIYFWNRIDDDQKKFFLRRITGSYYCYKTDWFKVLFKGNIDLFMFILRQCSMYGFDDALMEMSKSFGVLTEMLVWPYQLHNFLPNMEESCNNRNYYDYENILKKLPYLMYYERAYIGDDSRTRKLFLDLWKKAHSYKYREELAVNVIDDLYKYRDMESLKYIIIHEPTWKEREKLLQSIVTRSQFFKLKFLKEFIGEISQEINVKEWFINKLRDEKIVLGSL